MRTAFTLVELVVVILILGILAGVAAPRMFNTTELAEENGVRQGLSIVRDAIEMFNAQNGRMPGADGNESTFKSDVAPYLRRFPVLPVGPAAARDDSVVMDGSTGAVNGENSPSEGWRFYYKTGVFIVNLDQKLKSDNSITYDDL